MHNLSTHQKRIPDEEDGCIVAHKVPVAILSVELDSKPTGVPYSVSTARLTTCMGQEDGWPSSGPQHMGP